MHKAFIDRPSDFRLHYQESYAKWVHLLARAIWKVSGNDDLPYFGVFEGKPRDDWLWKISTEMKYPRIMQVVALVDRGNRKTAPFLRELHLRTAIRARVNCALLDRDGEWVGTPDVAAQLNDTLGMEAKLQALREPPKRWSCFRPAGGDQLNNAEEIGPMLPPQTPIDPWRWEIDPRPHTKRDKTKPQGWERRTERRILTAVKTRIELVRGMTWSLLEACVTPRGETLRIKEFIRLAEAIERTLNERKPRKRKRKRNWMQRMANKLRATPDLVRICNENFAEEYGGGRARRAKQQQSWGL